MPSPTPPEPASAEHDVVRRVAWLFGSLALVCAPVLAAELVPATDLPQHLAQARLMDEWFGLAPGAAELATLKLQPLAAHTWPYWPIWILSRLGDAALAGRLVVAALLCANAASLHYLAWARQRHPATALVASCFLFSTPLYWGFVNFLSGMPCFLLCAERMLRKPEPARARADLAWLAGLSLAMYGTHVFWLAAALPLGVLAMLSNGSSLRTTLTRTAALAPGLLATAAWLPGISVYRQRPGLASDAHYQLSIVERLDWSWFSSSVFGGLRGPWEPGMLALLTALGGVAALVGARRGLRFDRSLLGLGLAFLAFGLLAPEEFMNTILVGQRFVPLGACLTFLALPAPPTRAFAATAALVAGLFGLVTSLVWVLFNEDELQGLREAVASVDGPRSVLGLDLRQDSTLLRGRPFMQSAAYLQAEHGGVLNFSFTEHGSSIVANAGPRVLHWTPGLEWYPERLRQADVDAFDCVLVDASEEQHRSFAALYGLHSAQRTAFRLYCHE
jgi:hypothetical protein